MRFKPKTPKHLANQGGGDDRRRARRVAIGATVLVAAIAVLLAVVSGLGVQASPAGQPGQQASVGTAPQQGDGAGADVEQASATSDASGGASETDRGLPDGGGQPAPGDSGQGATDQASDESSAPEAPVEEEVGGATCEGGVVLVPIPEGATMEDVTSMLAGVDVVDAQSVEGQDLSLGFVRVQTKPGVTVADTVDQLSAAGVRSQPNYSYSIGEGEDEAPGAQAGAAGSTDASEGAPSDEAAEGGEAVDRPAADAPAGATEPSGAAVPADGGNAGGTEGDSAGASPSDAAGDEAAGDAEAEPAFSTNDPDGLLSYSSWNVQAPADLKDAWNVTRTDKRVTIAVLDTGCRVTHEDLRDNIVDTFDATKANKSNDLPGDVSDVTDVTGHGTHVAGIASARADNGKGVAGTSYNAGLSIVKVFPSYDVRDEATGVRKRVSSCYTDDMVIGYKHVLETRSAYNIRVVNMSIQGSRDDGFDDGDELLNDQVKAAYDAGIVTVCCAGNTNGNEKEDGSSSLPYRSFPADLDADVVGVMNLQGPDVLSGDSNYNTDGQAYGGTNKNICAPGTSVYSTTYGSDSSYGTMSGTSMAAPYVAGVVALEFSANPSLSPRQAMDVLYESADDVPYTGEGWDAATGYGAANAHRAVAMAEGTRDISAATAPLTVWAKGTSPDPNVTYGYEDGEPVTLRSGTDYTVTYKDNGNGTATRTITGKGRYSGRKVDTCPAVDQRIDVSSCTFDVDWACPGYRPIVKGKATVRSSSGEDVSCELVEGQDFRVTSGPTGSDSGTKTFTVEGVGAFTGSKTFNDFCGTPLWRL
ncbi:MAG: S8 family serine peptidase [Olsenella sp.]|jgi:subtilisin family serine protease